MPRPPEVLGGREGQRASTNGTTSIFSLICAAAQIKSEATRLAEKPNHESNSELSISIPIDRQNPSRLNSADLIAEIPLSDWETAKIVADWVSE
jgi:hypothetical protein